MMRRSCILCRFVQWLTLCLLGLSLLNGPVEANRPPSLKTYRVITLTGAAIPGKASTVVSRLRGTDVDGDPITFILETPKNNQPYFNISIAKNGTMIVTDICPACTGQVNIKVRLEDPSGASQSYPMVIKLQDRTGKLTLKSENQPTQPRTGLQRWHKYLIILATILAMGVITSLVMYNCCTFHPDIYEISLKRPNKIIDKADEPSRMNPHAQPRKMSLIVREAVRSGAADGAPYYGTRTSGVWVPTAPEDNEKKGQPTPLRLMSISEEPGRRESTAAPLPPLRNEPPAVTDRRISTDRAMLGQLSWYDISAPRR